MLGQAYGGVESGELERPSQRPEGRLAVNWEAISADCTRYNHQREDLCLVVVVAKEICATDEVETLLEADVGIA